MTVETFIRDGWIVLDLYDHAPVLRTKEFLESELETIFGKQVCLEEYHQAVASDEQHFETQIALNKIYREKKFCVEMISKNIEVFKPIVGLDIAIQINAFLRIARPNKLKDNIGYHRDTYYGASPYELSVLIPFVDVPSESCLKVISGSHVHSETTYPTQKISNPDAEIVKGSPKHKVGFPYAPHQMDPSIETKMEPVPLKFGQALVFCLPIVHGSRINEGATTRWSSDIRMKETHIPIEMVDRSLIYETVSNSPVTKCAKRYIYANEADARDEIEMDVHLPAGKR